MVTSSSWRIIRTPPASGPWNMSVDESLLESCLRRSSPPVLHLYSWQPACLSLGFSQPFSDVNRDAIQEKGWGIVRRPTGGRAILHVDELTYSICGLLSEPAFSGTLLESYSRLSRALQHALNLLGVQTSASEQYPLPEGVQPKGPVCFEVPSNYEITAHGRKLIGSAQARRKDALLQHGALPLTGDLTRITQALVYADDSARQIAAQRLLHRAATLETITQKVFTWDETAEAFEQAFSQVFAVILEPSSLTSEEEELAQHLLQTKYNHPSWTERL